MAGTVVSIGPDDNGRRMTLDEFDQAEGLEGYLYELGRGAVTVTEVPRPRHLFQVGAIRRQFSAYDLANPNRIFCIASGGECKILLADLESERHPDLAIYLAPPGNEDDIWSTWVPEIVIEVVSPGSVQRDYHEKPEEYLRFGIREYWIVDADERRVLLLRRSRGRWIQKIIGPGDQYKPPLLPGFEFDCIPVFDAADQASE